VSPPLHGADGDVIDALRAILTDDTLRQEPLTEADREPLRAACAIDTDIWQMYFWCLIGEPFDGNFDMMLSDPLRVAFAVRLDGALIGVSSFSGVSARHRTLEIGTTYLIPAMRGTGVNARMKRLMLGHAFACGLERVEFKVDVRNGRVRRR
jgi:RimJ/RimL family protein N-acetyltransferase